MSDQDPDEWGYRLPLRRHRPADAHKLIKDAKPKAVWQALPPDKQHDFDEQHPHIREALRKADHNRTNKTRALKTAKKRGDAEQSVNEMEEELKKAYEQRGELWAEYQKLLGGYIKSQGLLETVTDNTNLYMTPAQIAALGSSTHVSAPVSPATSPFSRAASPVRPARSVSPRVNESRRRA